MRRFLLLSLLLMAAPVEAQVVPQTIWPSGVSPIIFGMPAVNGSAITPASVGVPASTCAAPGIYLTTATTTGIAFTATPSVIICVNGTAILTSTASAVTSGVPILGPDGVVGAPSFAGTGGNSNSGYYFPGTDELALSLNGSNQWNVVANQFKLGSGFALGWTSGDPVNTSVDVSLSRGAANRLDLATGDSFNIVTGDITIGGGGHVLGTGDLRMGAGGSLYFQGKGIILTGTAPTIASGFGTSPSIPTANGTAAWTVNVGTGGTAQNGVFTLPAATNGWAVRCDDITTPASFVVSQTATTTTSATIQNYSRTTGLAIAWTASDILSCTAMAR